MEDITVLQKRIAKLESDHKAYVEFGAMCFIGILASGMIIDHTHNNSLWFLVLLLSITLVTTIVITVKKDLEKDAYSAKLKSLNSVSSSPLQEN